VKQKVLFIDRDGTLVCEPEDEQIDSLDKIRLVADVIPALLDLKSAGYRMVMVTNQDGLGTEVFPQASFDACHQQILELFSSQGISFDAVFICPHLPEDGCECRKPRTGLLTRYLAENTLDLERSAVIGDRESDLELAARLGIKGHMLDERGAYASTWRGIAAALRGIERAARTERKTAETSIVASVNLDAARPVAIATGIGFFDHMLEQVAKHGGFSLELACTGDLHIDEHHTVEDVAICLGGAIREALGDKRGIGRYGFLLPMDESAARIAIDLSGRGHLRFEADFPRDSVGKLSTEMVEHFFRSFADSLGAAIHLQVEGDNTHHMVEACFKSLGRALRQAIRLESSDLPSTKGMLA